MPIGINLFQVGLERGILQQNITLTYRKYLFTAAI